MLFAIWVYGQLFILLMHAVFSPHAGPSGAYSPDGTMGYMMDGQQMMHRPPGDPAFHNQYAHYPAEYYGHHLWGKSFPPEVHDLSHLGTSQTLLLGLTEYQSLMV